MSIFRFQPYSFEQLPNNLLYGLLKLRSDIFVVEQQCIYPDIDDKDMLADTTHIVCPAIAPQPEHQIIAYARCLPPGSSYAGCSIGRVAVAEHMRGQGIAADLMHSAIQFCQLTWPEHSIQIGAQLYLQDFYSSLGFDAISSAYDEDGIMHIDMQLNTDRYHDAAK